MFLLFYHIKLQLGYPKAVEIAVSVNGKSLVIFQSEYRLGLLTGLESLALTAVFGENIHPLDVVLGKHGMRSRADVYSDNIAINGDNGNVFLLACVNAVGDELFHGLAAADDRDTGVVYHANNVTAMLTDIELVFHNMTSKTD